MLAWCGELRRFCGRWQPNGPGVQVWQGRAAVIAGWQEWSGCSGCGRAGRYWGASKGAGALPVVVVGVEHRVS
jgi:hypothetical protein